ncbi:MAG: hypothetical protein Q4D56_11020 [Bacteroides sp.]|nr:hypothetical protein [Bacteroides sp.]
MNKKFLNVFLLSALIAGTTGTFTSCKDYDDDIDGLSERITTVEAALKTLQSKIDAGAVITESPRRQTV